MAHPLSSENASSFVFLNNWIPSWSLKLLILINAIRTPSLELVDFVSQWILYSPNTFILLFGFYEADFSTVVAV